MADDWLPTMRMELSPRDFERLPRHPAYKYEMIEGVAILSPWPRHFHAHLDLAGFHPNADDVASATLRPVAAQDQEALHPVFNAAFARSQPFSSLSDEESEQASRACLMRTFAGADGVLALPACFVALDDHGIAGAILITLLPAGDPLDWESCRWQELPPSDLWNTAGGQPHLTWIFVDQQRQGTGVGTLLLREAVRVLRERGYRSLWSTFMLGNDASMLWHWRNGFQLFPATFSKRRLRHNLFSRRTGSPLV